MKPRQPAGRESGTRALGGGFWPADASTADDCTPGTSLLLQWPARRSDASPTQLQHRVRDTALVGEGQRAAEDRSAVRELPELQNSAVVAKVKVLAADQTEKQTRALVEIPHILHSHSGLGGIGQESVEHLVQVLVILGPVDRVGSDDQVEAAQTVHDHISPYLLGARCWKQVFQKPETSS